VKVLKYKNDVHRTKQGLIEGMLSEQLSHPHIVQTFKTSTRETSNCDGVTELETWIVQEICALGTLTEYCCKHKRTMLQDNSPDMPRVIQMLLEIASGMCYLHERGILHGDLSANNVLIAASPFGSTHRCKINDFGLARCLKPCEEIKTQTLGTVTHMAPEALVSCVLSRMVDVYSWGILMYQIYTCQVPYDDLDVSQVVIHVAVKRMSLALPNDAPQQYRALFRECTNWDPVARPTFETVVSRLMDS
jgi:serine/threonine protein kinase